MTNTFENLLDEEQAITVDLLGDISTAIQLREEVSQRLIYRALWWSEQTIRQKQDALVGIASRANAAASKEAIV